MLNIPNRVLLLAAGALVVALLAAVVVKVWPILHPPVEVSAALNTACDLNRTACVSELPGGGRIELSIEPRPVLLLKPLQVSVQVQGAAARSVEVDFAGEDMKMAFNRPRLEAVGNGRFTGQVTLPVCVRDSMIWHATVLADRDGQLLAAPFRLETKR